MNSIKGVIFDLDGTLIESFGAVTQAFNEVLQSFGLEPISKDTLASFFDRSERLQNILLEIAPHVFENKETIRKGMEEIRKTYFRIERERVCLLPGAKEILSSLKMKGLKVGVVTARMTVGERKWLELRRLDIARFIDAMVTGGETRRKPAPDGIVKCLEKLGLSTEESIFVGDTQTDIIAGRRANIRVVAVSTGTADRKKLAAEKPTVIIDNLSQLIPTIQDLEKGRT